MNVVWGIRWDRDDDRRRGLLLAVALLAALGAVALLFFSHGASHGPLQAVIVRAEPNELAAAQRAVERHGGTVGQSLPVVNGFVAQVPAGSERALGATAGVAGVVVDSPMKGWADAGQGRGRHRRDAGHDARRRPRGDRRRSVGRHRRGRRRRGDRHRHGPGAGAGRQGKVVQGPDFSDQSRDRDLAHLDTYGHGTHVAGIIAGDDPESGFRGVAPGARLVNVKAAGADGSTTLGAIVASVGWVIAHRNDNGLHVRVLNLSFGTPPSRYQSDLLAYAVEQAWKAGIVVVVSAGNEGDKHRGLTSPAYDPFILSIGADDLVRHRRRGRRRRARRGRAAALGRNPDLVAPGRSIASLRDPNSALDLAHPEARVGDDLLKGSGTSQAAAVVSGAVALLLERRPDLTPDQVKAIVKSAADPLSGPGPDAQGAGRLNVIRALAAASPDPARGGASRSRRRDPWHRRQAGRRACRRADKPTSGPSARTARAGAAAKWGGAKWGAVGRLVLGRRVVGRLVVGRLLVGRLLVGRLVLGRLLVGRLLVGRLVLGRRLSRARPGLHVT